MNDTGKPSEDRGIIPLPLVIGVTGHRDLREEDLEPLEAQVRRVFAGLQSDYPSTPLILLSPLAEGADQLVARVALQKGVCLIVPLPMPQALYEEDFQTRASRDEFDKLLEQAERCIELPLLKDVREEEVREPGPARDQQYAQVGAYIVLHCQILIALWDGTYSDQVGGTSQVVQFQLRGVPASYGALHSPLDEPESGPVYHIVTPRVKNPAPVGRCFELRKLAPASSAHEYFEQDSNGHNTGEKKEHERSVDAAKQEFYSLLQHLDTFNRDAVDFGTRLAQEQEKSKDKLLGDVDITTLPPALKVTLRLYADLYAMADSLAIYFKDRVVNTLLLLFSLFFIAVVFFDVFAHLRDYFVMHVLQENPGEWLRFVFLFLYLIFLFIAYYIWYYRVTRGHYKNKYLDYRALAEGLRVQFFWRLAGVPDTAASHYLRKQKSELDWIRSSIRVANLLCDSGTKEQPTETLLSTSAVYYGLVVKQWLDSQSTYFIHAIKRDHSKLEGNARWVRRFFVIGIVLAVVLFILQFPQLPPQYREWIKTVPLIELLIIIMSLVLVLAALREGYADKMAYAEQVKQYQRMSHLFWLASQRLKDSLEQGKPQEAERVIRELGEEALAENGDWVMLHRTRPINVPKGG